MMMTMRIPTFRHNATATELFYDALCVESEYQAGAYMRGLSDYFRNGYPKYYGDMSRRALELAIWQKIKYYARKNHHPIVGLYRLYGIPSKEA